MVNIPYNIIKYKDRKLYSLDLSKTISLDDIIYLVKNKKIVKIKNYKHENITLSILAECYCKILKGMVDKTVTPVTYNKMVFTLKTMIQNLLKE